jgi:Lecithin:cholesterol acyltransferase
VPGIMGSELVDEFGRVVWGMKPELAVRALWRGQVPELAVTEEDAAAGGRLQASRLLRRVGYLPLLGGLEPYTDLLDHLRRSVVDERAVVEFPYDWRLPLDFNGRLLADRCQQVLEAWRKIVKDQRYAVTDTVRVMLVAHSMGGLVARYATEVYGAREIVSRIVTLGTPHFGAVKALQMLATGDFHVSCSSGW